MITKEHFFLFQINMWKTKLNHDLPSPLHQTEVWLQEVERLIEEDLSDFRNYSDAMTQIQEKMALFKVGKEKMQHGRGNISVLLETDLRKVLSSKERRAK